MNFATFDMEVFNDPEPVDWNPTELGIACAGIKTNDDPKVQLFYHPDYLRMSQADAATILFALETYVRNNYQIVTVNGAKFDFRVLAEETNQHERCARLAADHIDLTAACLCKYGWTIGLETLAIGAGHPGKTKSLKTRDGRIIDEMSGALVPELWPVDPEACLTYQIGDCDATLAIVEAGERTGRVRWRSASGKSYFLDVAHGWPTVRQAMAWTAPDTSWMTNPAHRLDLVDWINEALPKDEQIFVRGAMV